MLPCRHASQAFLILRLFTRNVIAPRPPEAAGSSPNGALAKRPVVFLTAQCHEFVMSW
jgi:hypothetical protein